MIIGRSLADSWSFPWYGNPDQDLVFLRDGLRLWRGQPPGYGDHPGLMQMVVVWISLGLLKALDVFGLARFVDFSAPSDSDWQSLFQVAKLINGFLSASLLVLCACLIAVLLGRLTGLLWLVLCSGSMALVSEIYQLRNEFYSSFFSIAAILIALGGSSWFCSGGGARVSAFCRAGACFMAFWGVLTLSFLAYLAKVQVLPVFLVFFVCVFGVGMWRFRFRFLKAYGLALGLLFLAALMAGSRFYGGIDISWLQACFILIGLASPAALLLSSCLLFQSPRGPRRGLFLLGLAIGSVAISSVFLEFARRAGWLALLANPLVVRAYAVAADGCVADDAACYWLSGFRGVLYLFERSVDSYLLAPVVAVLVLGLLVVVVCSLLFPSGPASFLCGRRQIVLVWASCACVFVAFAMAFAAGQRWAVDHYLSYQQPFLFLGLLMLSREPVLFFRAWRLILGLAFISVLLMYLRYPNFSRQTYVKERLDVVPSPVRGDGSLCASQHAGPEWRASSLRHLCSRIWE